jgi:hypothetical protein
MKNILIQNHNNKLFRNLSLLKFDNVQFLPININGNLYSAHYSGKIDTAIFAESALSEEIIQYITEFHREVKIIVYRDNYFSTASSIIRKSKNKNIFQNTYNEDALAALDKNITMLVTPQYIYNSDIYPSEGVEGLEKIDQIICFMDEVERCPLDLEKHLYPAGKKRIKLFNNPNIKSINNLGTLNELERKEILLESKNYLAIDSSYEQEARLCGCNILSLSKLDSINTEQNNKPFSAIYTYRTFIEPVIL